MDKVTRQVGQHIEFDPEWETAFNLVIKLQSTIALILEWCANDVRPFPFHHRRITSFHRSGGTFTTCISNHRRCFSRNSTHHTDVTSDQRSEKYLTDRQDHGE